MTHSPSSRRPKILVVDDEETLAELMEEALSQSGFDVARATSIAKAEALLTAFRPDVVITDVYFPEGPCWPFIASLRWLQPAPAVILVSAFGAAFGPQERELGDVVLAKPFRLGVMISVVRKLLAERGFDAGGDDETDAGDRVAPQS